MEEDAPRAPVAPPMDPFPDGFIHDAMRGARVAHAGHTRDLVAQEYPGLQHVPCVALPHFFDVTCAESALILALELTQPQVARNPKPFRDYLLTARVGHITLPQMRRACERHGIGHFPIYVAHAPPDAEGDAVMIPYRGSKHRTDNWAIIFLPDMEPAHFTFGRVELPAPQPDVDTPACVYTSVPFTPTEHQFWRCEVSKQNMTAFLLARAQGRACSCDLRWECVHEKRYMADNPAAFRLSFLGNRYVQGTYRCQLEKTSLAERCADYSVNVAANEEVVSVPAAYGCESIIDLGKLFSPFNMLAASLCPRPLEPWRLSWVQPDTIEIPTDVIHTSFGGLPVTGYLHEPRYGVFNAVQIGLGAIVGSAGLGFAISGVTRTLAKTVAVAPTVAPRYHRMSLPGKWLSYLFARLQELRPTLPEVKVRLPSLQVPTPETRAERLYAAAYNAIEKGVPCCMSFLSDLFERNKTAVRVCTFSAVAYLSWRLLRSTAQAALIRCKHTRLVPVVPAPRDFPYGYTEDLSLIIPDTRELTTRLATIKSVTPDHAYDLFRRLCAERGWDASKIFARRAEFDTWCQRVVTAVGETRLEFDRPGKCLNCKVRPMTYRLLCKACWRQLRLSPLLDLLISDEVVAYVGVVPIFSSEFNFPASELKDSAVVKHNGKLLFDKRTPPQHMQLWYKQQHVKTGYRGRSCGPIFMGQKPTCFPYGHETAVVAFLVRLGAKAPATPHPRWYALLRLFFDRETVPRIEPESREHFLSHFKGPKLAKMLEAESNINAGNYTGPDRRKPACSMGGFTKAEKSYWFTFMFFLFMAKTELKPRFICCPSPEFLFTIGPYTHAQTKWLAQQYTSTDHLYYAGCATPQDLNRWLNYVHKALGYYVSIADDISACDSSHSAESMAFHTYARKKLFGLIPHDIELHYLAEHKLRIRVGRYTLTVDNVNGSGVSDTSFKNSLLCLYIRLFAIAHAIKPLDRLADAEVLEFVAQVRNMIFTAASGDDGLTRCHRWMFGTDITSQEALARYSSMWRYFGFTVKVAVYTEAEWRMATFLASRPVWTGSFYEFVPEPARRMRGLFWQIDNSMHPVVWARSVATSLREAAAPHPVLGPLADWFLANTSGPVVSTSIFDNPYNPFTGYSTVGRVVTERAVKEFLLDYDLTQRDYDVFLGILRNTPSVYVSITCRLVQQLYRVES